MTTRWRTATAILLVAVAFLQENALVKALAGSGFQKKKRSGYRVDDSLSTQNFIQHLVDVEEYEGLEAVDVGFDNANLRGLWAKSAFAKGDYICAVPFVSTILLDETFYPSNSNTEEEVTVDMQELAVSRLENSVKFLERVLPSPKKLETLYRQCLPLSLEDIHFSPTPDFWTRAEIQELQVPNIVQELLERRNQAQDRANSQFSEMELLQALWVVRSRAFTTLKKAVSLDVTDGTTSEGLMQRCVLIPFLDLLNHSQASNAQLETVETKEYDESFYALVAKRPIKKGEQLTICYGTGEEASWEIYTKYGFWPKGHEKNDLGLFPKLPEPPQWTTTLQQDLDELALLQRSGPSPGNARQGILDFRIRMKRIEEQLDARSAT